MLKLCSSRFDLLMLGFSDTGLERRSLKIYVENTLRWMWFLALTSEGVFFGFVEELFWPNFKFLPFAVPNIIFIRLI